MLALDSLARNLKKLAETESRTTLTSGLSKSWAFKRCFVKEIDVAIGATVIR